MAKSDYISFFKAPNPDNLEVGALPGSASSAASIAYTAAELGGRPRMVRGTCDTAYFYLEVLPGQTAPASLTNANAYLKAANVEFELTVSKEGSTIILHSATTDAGRYYVHISSE